MLHGLIGYVVSNAAKLSDREAVRAVLSGCFYHDDDLEFVIVDDKEGAGGTLEVRGEAWPTAVPRDLMPDGDQEARSAGGEPEDNDPYDAALRARGEQGFTELLQKLAPYLLTPLMVQAVLFVRNRSSILAREWRVEPGVQAIEVNSFKYAEAIAAEHSAK